MRWPMLGGVFAGICLLLIAWQAHDWYHDDSLTLEHAWGDEDVPVVLSFFAGMLGIALSLIDIKKAVRKKSLVRIAWTGLVVNILLYPLTASVYHWAAGVNNEWLNQINSHPHAAILSQWKDKEQDAQRVDVIGIESPQLSLNGRRAFPVPVFRNHVIQESCHK